MKKYTVVGYFADSNESFVVPVVAKSPRDAQKAANETADTDARLTKEHDGVDISGSEELVIIAVFPGHLKTV